MQHRKAIFVALSMLTLSGCGSSSSSGSDDETMPVNESIAVPADEPIAVPADEPIAVPADEPIEINEDQSTNTVVTTSRSAILGEWRFCTGALTSELAFSTLHIWIFTEDRFSIAEESHRNSDCSGNVSLELDSPFDDRGTYDLVGEITTESGLTALQLDLFIEHPTIPELDSTRFTIIHAVDTDQILIGAGIAVNADARPQRLDFELPLSKQ